MADKEETETPTEEVSPSDADKTVIKGLFKEALTEFLGEYEAPKPKTNRPAGGMLESVFGIGKK